MQESIGLRLARKASSLSFWVGVAATVYLVFISKTAEKYLPEFSTIQTLTAGDLASERANFGGAAVTTMIQYGHLPRLFALSFLMIVLIIVEHFTKTEGGKVLAMLGMIVLWFGVFRMLIPAVFAVVRLLQLSRTLG